MKTVMVLAVNFPPTGGVGVIRTLKFVKYLPQFGWNPVVVTLPAGTKQIQDDSLLSEVPEHTTVHRPPYFDYRRYFPKPVVKLIQSYEKRVYFPDKYIRWNRAALKYIENEIVDKQTIDLLYTSVGPHSTLLLAHELKKRFNIPIFIDFRDPFSFSQYALLDVKQDYRKKAEAIETKVFKDADQINNVTRIWQKAYESRYPEIGPKSSLLHNGYDEDDFSHLNGKERTEVFTVGYNGTYSRIVPIEPLMEAIRYIHQEHRISIRLSIATPIKKSRLISKFPYLSQNNLMDHRGFLPHRQSLENLYQSDVSALILNDIPATDGMIPAKTFEYLRVGNPILLMHRKGSFLAELIEKTRTGSTVNISDPDSITQALLKFYHQWEQGSMAFDPDWNEIKTYERQYLTGRLAADFDRLAAGQK